MRRILLLISLLYTGIFAEDALFPNIKLKTLDGTKLQMKELYKNQTLLVNFWSLSCEPCKKEMKYLDKFNQKYSDDGFQVISVNIDNTRSMSKVKSYIKSREYSFEVFTDPKAELLRKTGGKMMPYILLVNKSGRIVNRHMGYSPGDEVQLEKDIMALIENSNQSIIPENLEKSG